MLMNISIASWLGLAIGLEFEAADQMRPSRMRRSERKRWRFRSVLVFVFVRWVWSSCAEVGIYLEDKPRRIYYTAVGPTSTNAGFGAHVAQSKPSVLFNPTVIFYIRLVSMSLVRS